jgi:hypothetical protein
METLVLELRSLFQLVLSNASLLSPACLASE